MNVIQKIGVWIIIVLLMLTVIGIPFAVIMVQLQNISDVLDRTEQQRQQGKKKK